MARRQREEVTDDRLLTNLLLLGGLMFLNSKSGSLSGSGQATETSIQPVTVYAGERVSADSYRRISGRRSGMDYAYTNGHLGSRITFDVARNGVFTRNVILEDGILYAELKFA